MAQPKLSWKFPLKNKLFFRIELFFVLLLAILIFIFSYYQFAQSWGWAIAFTLVFLVIYILVSRGTKAFHKFEEKYHLTPRHLEITRTTRTKTKKEKVHLKDLKRHKLDKFFLGGYLLTKKGKKHLLYFNTKSEVEKFENFVKKHLR